MPDGQDIGDVRAACGRLHSMVQRDPTVPAALQSIAGLARWALGGDPEASVVVIGAAGPVTAACTGPLALALDAGQCARGQGPCLHAARSAEITEVRDPGTERRWPLFAREAAGRGCHATLSVALPTRDVAPSALTLYFRRPLDDDRAEAARRLATEAAEELGGVYAYQHAREVAGRLETALRRRAAIKQATSLLMARYRLAPEQAAHALAGIAACARSTVPRIAERVVRTGEVPPLPPVRAERIPTQSFSSAWWRSHSRPSTGSTRGTKP